MPKKKVTPKEEERSPLYEAARKVLMAGIGAVALAQDEAENFVNKLVERGELAEKDARKLMDEVAKKRKETTKKTETQVEKRLEDILSRMNIPTKSDIQALSEKIAALTARVEELKKENGSAA
ncbi:MAG: poly(hydroxyalkanoate) granule-associated protein [Anaerolineae bacterium]|nr:MAG: poly(hydroxyalkanoate) granule-associated protein [Anaerolineae bacterium]